MLNASCRLTSLSPRQRCRIPLATGRLSPLALAVRCGLLLIGLALWLSLSRGVSAEPLPSSETELPESPTDLQKYPELQAAVDLFRKGNAAGSLEEFKKTSVKYPELPPGEVMFAQLCFSSNQLGAGRTALEQAVSNMPESPDAYLMLGEIAFQQRRFAESWLLFEKGLAGSEALPDDNPRKQSLLNRSRAGLSAVAEARGHWETAQPYLIAWIEDDPENAPAHARLGTSQFFQKEYEKAFEELVKASELDEKQAKPGVAMARLFTREGNAAKAREWMEYAVKKDPENAGTLLAVGQLLFEAGQFEAAQEHLEKALELEPDSLNAKLLSGLVARFLGQTAKAEEYFQDAHLQSPRNFGAANQLALVLIEQDDEVKQRRAVELAQLNQSQYTNIPEASATLGWVYLKLNQIDAATKALTDAFKQSGQLGPDALFYLANLYEMQGQNANAKQMLQQAISRTTPFAHRKDAENMLTKLKALDNAGETPPASAPEEQ